MKNRLFCLLLLLSTGLWAQERDRRAELNLYGRIDEISVSPRGEIWLVSATSKTYFTPHIDSNWHYGPEIYKAKKEFDLGGPHLDRVSFFNNDTALLTGYISGKRKDFNKGGYYRTTDGGKSWKLADFGGNAWIYSAQVNAQGQAWLGGQDRTLHYSSDFGKNWRKLQLPYHFSDRTYALYMADAQHGVVGSNENELLHTRNNWETAESLPTPLDQLSSLAEDGRRPKLRISKVQVWQNYLVVLQKGRIYYSMVDSIVWKPLPARFYDFEVDTLHQRLFAVGDSLEIVAFRTPEAYDLLLPKSLKQYVQDLKAVNGALYGILSDYSVFRLDADGFKRRQAYTTDEKIKTPELVRQGKTLRWGANGNQIYLADARQNNWFREREVNFYIHDFKLLNDSMALLWDGYEHSYRYDLRHRQLSTYSPELPLQDFLASPLAQFTINAGSRGCYHHQNDQITYRAAKGLVLVSTRPTIYVKGEKQFFDFQHTLTISELLGVFHQINQAPSHMPMLSDFKIESSDIQLYEQRLTEELKNDERTFFNRKKIDSSFFFAFPARLDSLEPDLLRRLFTQKEGWTSTTTNWFIMYFVNEAGDTLHVSRAYYVSTHPGHLPWIFEYKGQYFACYNAAFSRLIGSCLPKEFTNQAVFDNAYLLRAVAGYLWERVE